MQHARRVRRSFILAIAFLTLWATGEPALAKPRRSPPARLAGAYAAFLEGKFAFSEGDFGRSADAYLRALATDPANAELIQQAFLACVMSGRPEAARLARELPNNPVAQPLLAGIDARNGNWDSAEQRFRALTRQGPMQILQPLLVAWAQQGAGRSDAALATLRPYVDGQRFRGIYALHAALIADLAGRTGDAARLYRIAHTEYGGMNLRLAQTLASWQARQGHMAEAQQTLKSLGDAADDMLIALPAMTAAAATRPVARATDGIAEAYLALAVAARQADSSDFSTLLLRLALALRPDFTAGRLVLADFEAAQEHFDQAARTLAPIGPADPLVAVVRLRRADFAERMGKSDEAARELEQIARDYPDSPAPLAQLGDVLRSKNQFADAVSAYDRALQRVAAPQRSAWRLFYARGVAEERAGNWPKAQDDLERALQLAPDQPYVLNYLGYSWADQGQNLQQARQMLTRAVELRPNDGSIVDSLGWVLLRQGDTNGAVRSLERAVELVPEDATINGHLGDVYWAAGRKTEAQFQWRRALLFNPEPDEAAKLESKLKDFATQADGPATAEHRVQ